MLPVPHGGLVAQEEGDLFCKNVFNRAGKYAEKTGIFFRTKNHFKNFSGKFFRK